MKLTKKVSTCRTDYTQILETEAWESERSLKNTGVNQFSYKATRYFRLHIQDIAEGKEGESGSRDSAMMSLTQEEALKLMLELAKFVGEES